MTFWTLKGLLKTGVGLPIRTVGCHIKGRWSIELDDLAFENGDFFHGHNKLPEANVKSLQPSTVKKMSPPKVFEMFAETGRDLSTSCWCSTRPLGTLVSSYFHHVPSYFPVISSIFPVISSYFQLFPAISNIFPVIPAISR